MTAPSMSIRDAIEHFLEQLAQQQALGVATQQAYRRDLLAFAQWGHAQQMTALDDVDVAAVRAFAAAEHRRGLSPRSIARRLSALRRFFKHARRQGWSDRDPTQGVQAPKIQRKLPETLDMDQVLALLDLPTDTPLAIRDRAMLEMFYASGLRVSELAQLCWRDLDQAQGLVRVLGKGQKQRLVPVGRHALKALAQWQAHQAPQAERVFTNLAGRPLTTRALQKRVAHWSQRQGLDQRVHPHQLRHSFASHILQSSGDLRAVQELLGHANLSTTQIYTHLDYQHLAKVYDQAHPRAKKST